MLDHVIIFLKEDDYLVVKNTDCSLLDNVKSLHLIPIDVRYDSFNNGKVLELTTAENLICVVDGYDYKFPDCCLNMVAIRPANTHFDEIPVVRHIDSIKTIFSNGQNNTHCYTMNGNFPIYQNEHVESIKETSDKFIDISLI